VLDYSQEEISKLIQKVDASLNVGDNKIITENIPDIQTRHITEKSLKKFLETFAKGGISTMREDVHNAGRYNEKGSKVNVDMMPYLLTLLDVLNDEVIKTTNDELETEINNEVKNNLAGDLHIPTYFSQ
jgi:hypothetical protein